MDSWKINWVEKSWQIFWIKGKTYSYLTDDIIVVKIKKQKTQKSMSLKENSNLKSLKTVSKQLNLRIR